MEITKDFLLNCNIDTRCNFISELARYKNKSDKNIASNFGLKLFKVTCEDYGYGTQCYVYHTSEYYAKNEIRGKGLNVLKVTEVK